MDNLSSLYQNTLEKPIQRANFGAKDQDRTGDPSLFRGMLYQLSYLGNVGKLILNDSPKVVDAYLPKQLPWRWYII